MPKPKGSGYFALVSGAGFVVVFFTSFFVRLRNICPYSLLQAWLAFSAIILVCWGANRIRIGAHDWTIGQDTINFVVGLVGATIALFTLVSSAPVCGQ